MSLFKRDRSIQVTEQLTAQLATRSVDDVMLEAERMEVIPEMALCTGYVFPEAVVMMARKAEQELNSLMTTTAVDKHSRTMIDFYVDQLRDLAHSCFNDQQRRNRNMNRATALRTEAILKSAENKWKTNQETIEKLENELYKLESEDTLED